MALTESKSSDTENNQECGGNLNATKWTCFLPEIKPLQYRKIMRRTDMIKILFVCVCLCHVCPAHPCGSDPMRHYEQLSNNYGVSLATMMRFLERDNPQAYSDLTVDYTQYNECMRMLHTGYFKRSADNFHKSRRRETVSLLDILSGGGKRRNKRYGSANSRFLRELMSRDDYTDDEALFPVQEDSPIMETETVPEDVLEKTLPALLKRLYNNNKEVAVILIEPSRMAKSDSPRNRRHKRNLRHR